MLPRLRSLCVVVFLFALAILPALSAVPQAGAKPALPTIVVLATGGTIAGAAASDVQAGYTSGQVGVRAAPGRRAAGEEAGRTSAASRSRTSARRT